MDEAAYIIRDLIWAENEAKAYAEADAWDKILAE